MRKDAIDQEVQKAQKLQDLQETSSNDDCQQPEGTLLCVLIAVSTSILWIYCGFGRRRTSDAKLQARLFKVNLISDVARVVDPGIKYNADGMIMPLHYKDSRLYPDNFSSYEGKDLVYGTYRDIPFQFSWVRTHRHTPGDKKSNDVDFFRGIFFMVDFNKKFHDLTLVKPDTLEKDMGRGISSFLQKMDSSQPGKLIRMEDPVFEKEFVITTEDEQEARY